MVYLEKCDLWNRQTRMNSGFATYILCGFDMSKKISLSLACKMVLMIINLEDCCQN